MDKSEKRKWSASGREPVKTVRFLDGVHAAHGTLEEIERKLKEKFPERKIEDIVEEEK